MFSTTSHHYCRLPRLPQLLPQQCRARAALHTQLPTTTTTTSTPSSIITTTIIPKLHPDAPPIPLTPSTITTPKLAADDPALQSTWSHRAWVTAGLSSVLVSLAKSAAASASSGHHLEPLLAALAGYVLADLGSGVYHWAIDNYGDASTPVFGPQIDAFQGHHRWPWTITRRQFANNLHSLARVVMVSVVPVELITGDAVLLAFVGAFAGCIMLSQQFHAWAHGTRSRLPAAVVALQDAGVLVPREMHAAHHRPPYNGNYCIVSGVWNGVLDRHRVFEAAEMAIFFRFGVRPRSWSEPGSEWLEEEIAGEAVA